MIEKDGVSSFKLHMAYPGVLMVNDADIYRTMREVRGKVDNVFLCGKLIVDGDDWRGDAGMGAYQRRSASGRVI